MGERFFIMNTKKKTKVLIIGDVNHTLIKELVENIQDNNTISIDILTLSGAYEKHHKYFRRLYSISMPTVNNKNRLQKRIFQYYYLNVIKDVISQLEDYDVIHIHYVNPMYRFLINNLKKKTSKLYVTLWGSDYYRISDVKKRQLKSLYDKVDKITFTNKSMEKEFLDYYNDYFEKVEVHRFGLKTLDEIKKLHSDTRIEEKKREFKEKYNIPEKKYIVTCGYNASPGQQYEEMIKALEKIKDKKLKNLVFLFPMSYGDDAYRNKVINLLGKSKINSRVLLEYFENEETALFRMISDIMINVQVTDQLSGSMQETLFAGNIVINGSWLPYGILKNKKIYFEEVDKIDQLSDKIEYCIENIETLKKKNINNARGIWSISSWEKNRQSWNYLYRGEE